jgi:proline dehydrogenase
MRQFNQLPSGAERLSKGKEWDTQPLVYTTCQAYLRRCIPIPNFLCANAGTYTLFVFRTPEYLARSVQDAKANNYALGVKLVRGAYHPHEIAAHERSEFNPHCNNSSLNYHIGSNSDSKSHSISPDKLPPVWATKDETDRCFNESARLLLRAIKEDIDAQSRTSSPTTGRSLTVDKTRTTIPAIGVIFGTHNRSSCSLILDELVASGLASKAKVMTDGEIEREVIHLPEEVTDRVGMGQLYG